MFKLNTIRNVFKSKNFASFNLDLVLDKVHEKQAQHQAVEYYIPSFLLLFFRQPTFEKLISVEKCDKKLQRTYVKLK